MTGRLRGKFKPVLVKYAMSYIALMVVLFAGISTYMYVYFNNAMRENAVESSINKLSRIRYQQEGYFTTLLNIADQMSLSPYITPFKFKDDPWKAYKLLQQLKPYTVTTSFCDQMFLIFNEDDTMYSSASSMKLDFFLHKLMLFDDTTPEKLESLIRKPGSIHILKSQKIKSILLDGSSLNMVTIIAPLGISLRENTGTLLFMIRESTFHTLFRDEVSQSGNTYVINGGEVIVSGESFALPKADLLAAVELVGGAQSSMIKYNGNDYLLVMLDGQDFKSVTYCTVIALSTITSASKSGLGGVILLLTALSIPCVLLIWFFTRSNYKPIRQLRSLFPETFPSKDDFGVIQEGIAELAAQNIDLNTKLDESIPLRRSSFILSFIKGRFSSRKDAIVSAANLDINIDRKHFAVVLAGLSPQSGKAETVETLLSDPAPNAAGCGTEIFSLDQLLFVLFADDRETLEAWAEKIREKVTASFDYTAVSISGLHDDFSMIKTAYLEANSAYDNRFVMGVSRLLRFEDICITARDVVPQARSYTDGIKQAMLTRNAKLLRGKVNDLLSFLKRTEMSLFAFRLIYNDVIDAILSEHEAQIGKAVDVLQFYDVFTLSGCRSIDDLDGILRNLCDKLLSNAEPQAGGASAMQDVVNYINEHFSDPGLSMNETADRFGLSTARLSLDFKEFMHMSPSDYLLLLRMEKSKELLNKSDLSIKEICTAVGYYDPSSFTRRFKQYTAVTPLQYKLNIQRGEKVNHAQG